MAKKHALDWTLAPAPESTDHVKINAQYELFINGKWVKPKSGKYFDTINPANEQKLARIAPSMTNERGIVLQLSDRSLCMYFRPNGIFLDACCDDCPQTTVQRAVR
ncbi:MAG: hypothetical protein JNJ64_05040 [Flavobacteriales bacterium]|nr:hypothetical protein [Flavobacteriales bacterium]